MIGLKIGIIDCDALYYKNEFPNINCLSAYAHYSKYKGNIVELIIKKQFNQDDYDLILAYGNIIPDFIKETDKIKINVEVPFQKKLSTKLYDNYCKTIQNAPYARHFRGYTYVYSSHPSYVDTSKRIICVLDNPFKYQRWKYPLTLLEKYGKPIHIKQPLKLASMTTKMLKRLSSKDYTYSLEYDRDCFQIVAGLKGAYDIQLSYTITDTIDSLEKAFEVILELALLDKTVKINLSPYYKISHWRDLYDLFAEWANTRTPISFYDFVAFDGMNKEVRNSYKCKHLLYLKNGYKKGKKWELMDDFLIRFPEMKYYFVKKKPLLL